ncbi:serine carboxypeptidase-like 35 [Canna indica]|uniref:Carboxypeptidase n=1 Tax=Canna indica TaxID=4628 RepID=A0AAQ3JPQ0_9LILI|nr:serine carboxypeptidase-like 35 [Canna indica]
MALLVPSFLQTLMFVVVIVAMIKGSWTQKPTYLGQSDLIVDLPGQPQVEFRHYAGYVRINEDKSMFYWFYKAVKAPSKKPLLLWLNGGPGCSSIAKGALQELGPFLVTNDGSNLVFNPYTWSNVANLLFLESPVGVGFSYSNKSSDLENQNDEITAKDTYIFLINWFIKFPEFKSHEFYIAGESYAGHYVPQLAILIHEKNKISTKDSHINLKGLLIGNPLLDLVVNYISMAKFAWTRGLISYDLYQIYIDQCDLHPMNNSISNWNQGCRDAIDAMYEIFGLINHFNIFLPTCSKSDSQSLYTTLFTILYLLKSQKKETRLLDPTMYYDPCAISMPDVYLNRLDVQKALHANVSNLPYSYSACRSVAMYCFIFIITSVLPILRNLLDVGYRVWIYNGDADGAVPMQSTRESIMSMNLTEKIGDMWGGWRKWYYEGQIAGWMVEYVEGLSFITIRGAGHMVPTDAPGRALTIFSQFIKGGTLPNSTNTKI